MAVNWEHASTTGHSGADHPGHLRAHHSGNPMFAENAVLIADAALNRVFQWSEGLAQGVVVAGEPFGGNQTLGAPCSVALDPDGALVIVEYFEQQVSRWRPGATEGEIVAGGHGAGSGLHQLHGPGYTALGPHGEIFVSDSSNHRVVAWMPGSQQGRLVAGGNGAGIGLHQLNNPVGIAFDPWGYLVIVDTRNHRIMRWDVSNSASDGVVIAGGRGRGQQSDQLDEPMGLAVDADGSIFIADSNNHRIMKWRRDAEEGVAIAGGNGEGRSLHQLRKPSDVALTRTGDLFIAEMGNMRPVKWIASTGALQASAEGNYEGRWATPLATPIGIAAQPEGFWPIWSSEVHSGLPQVAHDFVRTVLLCQIRNRQTGLGALGNLLSSHVLPFAMPLCPVRFHACLAWSSGQMDSNNKESEVIEVVVHAEEAAQIEPDEATQISNLMEAGFLERNIEASPELLPASGILDVARSDEATHQHESWQPEFETILELRLSRNPKQCEERLHRGPELETVRAALNEEGYGSRLPSGAAIFVRPQEYQATKKAIAMHRLRPYHVIVSHTLYPLVLEAINAVSCRSKVRVRSREVFAYTSKDASMDSTIKVKNSFLCIAERLNRPESIVQSTSAAHGSANPRQRVLNY